MFAFSHMVHEAYASRTPVSPEVLCSFLLMLLIQIIHYSSTWTSAEASSSKNKPSFPSPWSLPFNSACMLPLGQDVGKVIVGTGASSRVLLVPGIRKSLAVKQCPFPEKAKHIHAQ